MKCIVCNELIDKDEFDNISMEFKEFPAHGECFDTFDDAECFLEFAKNKL